MVINIVSKWSSDVRVVLREREKKKKDNKKNKFRMGKKVFFIDRWNIF